MMVLFPEAASMRNLTTLEGFPLAVSPSDVALRRVVQIYIKDKRPDPKQGARFAQRRRLLAKTWKNAKLNEIYETWRTSSLRTSAEAGTAAAREIALENSFHLS